MWTDYVFLSAIVILIVFYLFIDTRASDFKGVLHGFEFNTIPRSALPCGVIESLDKFCTDPERCSTNNLPDSFDSRVRWPGRITQALNQEKCGSCWAFATTTAISDRIRIQSVIGKNTLRFEKNKWIEHVDHETNDTPLMEIVQYKTSKGLNNISPYTFAGCDVCELAEKMDPAIKQYFGNGICNECCDGGVLQYACIYAMIQGCITYGDDPEPNDYTCTNYTGEPIYKVKSVYHIEGEKNIMANILHNGPVISGYNVTSNFGFPQGKIPGTDIFGVPSSYIGGHAVCIIGWGVDKDLTGKEVKYWLCRNSWGDKWNGDGTFKFVRGVNFCGIEDDVWGVTPFKVYDMQKGPVLPKPPSRTCERNAGGVVNPQ